MLDLIYGLRPVPAGTTSMGAAIYGFPVQAPAAAAVRVRRNILAAKLDEVADQIVFHFSIGRNRSAVRYRARQQAEPAQLRQPVSFDVPLADTRGTVPVRYLTQYISFDCKPI